MDVTLLLPVLLYIISHLYELAESVAAAASAVTPTKSVGGSVGGELDSGGGIRTSQSIPEQYSEKKDKFTSSSAPPRCYCCGVKEAGAAERNN